MGEVLSGRYVGNFTAIEDGWLAIRNTKDILTFVTKHHCKKYEFVDEKYGGADTTGAIAGALIAGAAGAVIGGAGDVRRVHVKITWEDDVYGIWNDGCESLLSLSFEEYQALIKGMKTTMSKDDWNSEQKEQKAQEDNAGTIFKVIGVFVVIGYIIYYIIAGSN